MPHSTDEQRSQPCEAIWKIRRAIVIALLVALVFLAEANSAVAKLMRGPEIQSVEISRGNPDVVCIRLFHFQVTPEVSALSTDGGLTFHAADEKELPKDLTPNLDAGRYVLADRQRLFRSDDGGATWQDTGAYSFLKERVQAEIDEEKKWFRNTYRNRLPDRSVFWHPLFALFAMGYVVTVMLRPPANGELASFLTAMRGVIVILVTWCFLLGVHAFFRRTIDSQYPSAYWDTSAYAHPSAKLGFVMAITARPLPLLAYLAALWPILPGSLEALLGLCPSPSVRRMLRICVAVEAGLFVLFHLGMMFVGPIFE